MLIIMTLLYLYNELFACPTMYIIFYCFLFFSFYCVFLLEFVLLRLRNKKKTYIHKKKVLVSYILSVALELLFSWVADFDTPALTSRRQTLLDLQLTSLTFIAMFLQPLLPPSSNALAFLWFIPSVTSTNFSFLNFGKFLKFCSDDKKFLKFCRNLFGNLLRYLIVYLFWRL